ncbi:Tat pathway signal sequence domain protein [Streptomyces sp. NPDC048664]|uniref:Tat pathway signal sequence domain protein n=1 Tax=Streptomyces sp. NPDC048664 TaxID=3154505 RepID=UPI00344139F9
MRTTMRRHLGKVLAGTAIAVTGTAVMVGITLPGAVSAEETGGRAEGIAARGAGGQDAVPPAVVEGAPAEKAQGTGGDPLTDDEIQRAERVALGRQHFAGGQDVRRGKGPQRLGVDLAAPAADELDDPKAPRRADVILYDYASDAVVTKTVDLDSGKVERTTTQHDVQPPLSGDENAEAARLLIADPLGAGLRADFKNATGAELRDPGQLMLTGIVYRATPGAQPAALGRCGEHRCVRLLPKIPNGPWIDARSLVVDLSARTVAALG